MTLLGLFNIYIDIHGNMNKQHDVKLRKVEMNSLPDVLQPSILQRTAPPCPRLSQIDALAAVRAEPNCRTAFTE